MKKLETKDYKGFRTGFFLTPKVEKYLKDKKVDFDSLKWNYHFDDENYSYFYEAILFDLIDENDDGKPDNKFGREFEVVYYGINVLDDGNEKSVIDEESEVERKEMIEEGNVKVDGEPVFSIKYGIFMK